MTEPTSGSCSGRPTAPHRLPDTDGLAIDRMDLIPNNYNTGATTASPGTTGKPALCVCFSWQQLMSKLGP